MRDIFSAAGGTHDDWDTYDRVMADENMSRLFGLPADAALARGAVR